MDKKRINSFLINEVNKRIHFKGNSKLINDFKIGDLVYCNLIEENSIYIFLKPLKKIEWIDTEQYLKNEQIPYFIFKTSY